jgi:hypothetical protein
MAIRRDTLWKAIASEMLAKISDELGGVLRASSFGLLSAC